MNQKTIWIGVLLIFVALVIWLVRAPGRPGRLDAFASCIKDTGTLFYGAFWCPHCQNQKALFGSSARLLPYVECSTPDGSSQLTLCKNEGVVSYPTWKFPDGTIKTGEVGLQELSELTSCTLPEA